MNTNRIEKWLSLVANLAVLAGIVFLALEVRQSNRIAITANEIAIRGQFDSLNELILANDDVAQLIARTQDADAEFTPAERQKLFGYAYTSFNTWLTIETAYNNDMVTEATYKIVSDDVRDVLQYYPALRPFFQSTLSSFPSLADSQVVATIHEVLAEFE